MTSQPHLFRIERFASEVPAPAISLVLPWPPSVNRYWRHVGSKVLISRQGRQYRLDVAASVLAAGPRKPLSGRLAVEYLLWMPDRIRRDLDNVLKALNDALKHVALIEDDSQFDRITVARAGLAPPGRVEVRIAKL